MTNLDSVLKSRDITLLPKVHLVKAMVFPVINTTVRWFALEMNRGHSVVFEIASKYCISDTMPSIA